MTITSLIFNRYTIGLTAVALFVVPWIQTHVTILTEVAEILSRVSG